MQLPLRSMCVCALRLNEMNSNEIRVWMRMRECAERKPEEHDAFDSRSNSYKNNKDICNIKWRSGAPPAKQRQPHGTTTTTRVHRQPRRLHLFALPLPGSTTLAVEEHICAINIMTLVVACAYMYVWCECNRNAQRKWELCNDEICNECVRARCETCAYAIGNCATLCKRPVSRPDCAPVSGEHSECNCAGERECDCERARCGNGMRYACACGAHLLLLCNAHK